MIFFCAKELVKFQNDSAAYEVKVNKTVTDKVIKISKKALITEYTGLLAVHIIGLSDNKPKLRTALQSTLKLGKAELYKILKDADQDQTLVKLLHLSLQSRVTEDK